MIRRTTVMWLVVLALAALALGSCEGDGGDPGDAIAGVGPGLAGTDDDFTADDGKLRVATTVAPITSIVLNVGGDRIRIHGLIPDGVDSHTYEPRPSDAQVLSRADMLIMNGAGLETPTARLAEENLPDASRIHELADNTLEGDDPETGFLYDFSFPRSEGNPNPHLWMDPMYALHYAELVRDWLSGADPDNADYYAENYDRFAEVIDELDAAIIADQETVPPENRKLLTYHDSWAYWARRYGWEVVGAIQPSDFSEPSAQEVARIIDQIREQGVPAVFGSEVFPSSTLEAIADETGATFVDELSDDAPPGEVDAEDHTYVGMIVYNMRLMFESLGGTADAVEQVPVTNSFVR